MIIVREAITAPYTVAASNKNNIIKNWVLFTACLNEINNTQKVNAKDNDIVMAMYN